MQMATLQPCARTRGSSNLNFSKSVEGGFFRVLARQARMASTSAPAAEQKKQWTAGRAKRTSEAHNLSYKFLIQNQRVGVCQIVTPVGALRQNPSNAARQMKARVRAYYIPSNAHTL